MSDVMRLLNAHGHTITYDWTTNEQTSVEQADLDLQGVFQADAFVMIAEKNLPYCGTLVELGVALALDLPIYVLGNALDHCLFLQLPSVTKRFDILLE